MHDFFCSNPDEMHYPELAKRAQYFKCENKGVSTVCEIMENLVKDIQEEGRQEGIAEGLTQGRSQMAIDMLRDKKPIEEIVKYSRLTLEQVQELAQQI